MRWHLLLACLVCLISYSAQATLAPVLGVDLGNEYMKISAIAPGHNLEMILNTQSKRKTRSTLNLAGQIRQFGEGAFAQQTMQPNTTMQFWPSHLGLPASSKDALLKRPNAFDAKWYPYDIADDAGKRHTLMLGTKPGQTQYFEDLIAHLLSHGKALVKQHLKDLSYTDDADVETAFAVPADLTYRQRQLLRQSATVAGLKPIAFVPEPLAAAISHSLDIPAPPERKEGEAKPAATYKVFLDVGSKHTQACLVKFDFLPAPDSVRSGIGRQRDTKEVLSIDTIECASLPAGTYGAHQLDVLIAEHLERDMLKTNRIKETEVTPRARRRLVRDAGKVKHTLSTNKDASVFVEGYAQGKDLRTTLTREAFEGLIQKSGWLGGLKTLKNQLEEAFKAHRKADNLPNAPFLDSLEAVELIGGGWRVPRVLSEIEKLYAPAPPGQKCNSDESMAVGAAMIAANHSSTYKFKPILTSVLTTEPYEVEITYSGGDKKTEKLTLDFPARSRFGASKKRVINLPFDSDVESVRVVARNGQKKVLDVWTIDGVSLAKRMRQTNEEKVEKAKQKFEKLKEDFSKLDLSEMTEEERSALHHTWTPLAADSSASAAFNVSLTVSLNQMGLISVEKAVAGWNDVSIHENTYAKVLKKKADPEAPTDETASTTEASSESSSGTKSKTPAPWGDGEDSTTETATASTESSSTVSTSTTSTAPKFTKHVFAEQIQKQMKALTVSGLDVSDDNKDLHDDEKKALLTPYPMTPRQIRDARNALRAAMKHDLEIEKLNELKNRLETYIYEIRSSLRDDDDIQAVSTEKERDALTELLQEYEDWIYDDEGVKASLSVVEKKMTALKNAVAAVMTKATELKGREGLMKRVGTQIQDAKKKIETLKESKPWLREETATGPVSEAIAKFETWLEETQKTQAGLSPKETPLLTKAIVEKEWKVVVEALSAFGKIKKPRRKEEEL